MIQSRLVTIPVFLVLLFCSLQAAATSVLPVSLQRMAASAETIFHGTAINNEVRLDQASGRVATYTTFKVIEVIKGNPGATHTIKQIGGQLPGSHVRQVIHGVPRFTAGEEYVIFLPKASSLGFASPIGLSQGKFDIRKSGGDTVISNGRSLAALMKTTPRQDSPDSPSALASKRTPALKAIDGQPAGAHLTDFMQAVRSMVNE
jgi:hypothetical protein